MILDVEFIETLPSDKFEAGILIARKIVRFNQDRSEPQKYEAFDQYVDALAALDAFIQVNDLPFQVPTLEKDKHKSINSIVSFCWLIIENLEKKLSDRTFTTSFDKYKSVFTSGFSYRFTDGDLSRIQELINELRDLIVKSELFDAKHKDRLLKRLEILQSELHKKMSSLDRFWGLVGEAGVVLGKFGQDAKPFVDRIKEIAQIIWRTQSNAEELPSGTGLPLLKSEEN